MTVRAIRGDCLRAMRLMAALGIQVDSVVTDPPYHLTSIVKRFGANNAAPAKDRDGLYQRASRGFMGKTWDGGDIAANPETWALACALLKPGGHLVAFGGTRTYHRMVTAIEGAGFEIRDQLAWMFGSGFPKSHSVGKAIDKAAGAPREIVGQTRAGIGRNARNGGEIVGGDHDETQKHISVTAPATDAGRAWEGWGTALKPAHEPICLARKPLSEKSIAANVLRHGTGAINIDGCRVPTSDNLGGGDQSASTKTKPEGWDRPWMHDEASKAAHAERVNANVERAEELGRWPANVCHDGSDEVVGAFPVVGVSGPRSTRGAGGQHGIYSGINAQEGRVGYLESGHETAARFFYSAKAGPDDRYGSKHPTVKPVSLMRWLVRLVTPPGGLVLDPFAGTGSTGIACIRESMRAILIEREPEYYTDIGRRIAALDGSDAPLFTGTPSETVPS